jgi:hypothetical protein
VCLTFPNPSLDGPLTIDAVTGEVWQIADLDFEQPQQRFMTLTVTARDQGSPSLSATATIALNVQPRNEFKPALTSAKSFTVSEDTVPGEK